MDQTTQTLLTAILDGGPGGIIAVLCAVIIGLLWDRKKMAETLTKKEDRIEKIIDEYYKGNMTLTDALNGLKLVLSEIKAQL